mgnify:CR=1 FL=1
MNRTRWMSQAAAESLHYIDNYAVISITEPGETAKIDEQYEASGKLLRLQFHDADGNTDWQIPGYTFDDDVLFTKDMAKQVLGFVSTLEGVDVVVVHCHAGISRSAAVAIALAQIHNLEEQYGHYMIYNTLVYREMMNAHLENLL